MIRVFEPKLFIISFVQYMKKAKITFNLKKSELETEYYGRL